MEKKGQFFGKRGTKGMTNADMVSRLDGGGGRKWPDLKSESAKRVFLDY